MKISLESPSAEHAAPAKLLLRLPFGLIGLRQLTDFELEPLPDEFPFQVLRSRSNDAMEFIVVEPAEVVDNYSIALRSEDVEALSIADASDALVLNIVAIHSHEPQFVTINLVGPLVVNRRTMVGQQVIIANSTDFSIEHVLVDQRSQKDGLAGGPANDDSQPLN